MQQGNEEREKFDPEANTLSYYDDLLAVLHQKNYITKYKEFALKNNKGEKNKSEMNSFLRTTVVYKKKKIDLLITEDQNGFSLFQFVTSTKYPTGKIAGNKYKGILLAQNLKTNELVAIKFSRFLIPCGWENAKNIFNTHEAFVKTYSYGCCKNYSYLVMELADDPVINLYLTGQEAKEYMTQMISVALFMLKNKLSKFDPFPGNMLCAYNSKAAKICDYDEIQFADEINIKFLFETIKNLYFTWKLYSNAPLNIRDIFLNKLQELELSYLILNNNTNLEQFKTSIFSFIEELEAHPWMTNRRAQIAALDATIIHIKQGQLESAKNEFYKLDHDFIYFFSNNIVYSLIHIIPQLESLKISEALFLKELLDIICSIENPNRRIMMSNVSFFKEKFSATPFNQYKFLVDYDYENVNIEESIRISPPPF